MSDLARLIVDAVLKDLRGRRGFRHVIESLHSDLEGELRHELEQVVDAKLPPPEPKPPSPHKGRIPRDAPFNPRQRSR